MNYIKVKTKALKYAKTICIYPEKYAKYNCLYLGLYTSQGELYDDLSTFIYPVMPGMFFVEKGTEKEKFCKEQEQYFTCIGLEYKQGFNTYVLYKFNTEGE